MTWRISSEMWRTSPACYKASRLLHFQLLNQLQSVVLAQAALSYHNPPPPSLPSCPPPVHLPSLFRLFMYSLSIAIFQLVLFPCPVFEPGSTSVLRSLVVNHTTTSRPDDKCYS